MASGDKRVLRNTGAYTMDISVGKDKKMGDANILSASSANPEELSQRGVKVYDDVQRVVYEVCSGGTTTLENGVHPWRSSETDALMQRVGQSLGDGAGVTVTRADAAGAGGLTAPTRANQDTAPGARVTEGPARSGNGRGDTAAGSATRYAGEGTPRALELDGAVHGDAALIDEDDDRSLREKTVTDMSAADGTAADLVAGRPLSVASEPPSEDKEESPVAELPPAVTQKKKRCRCRCCTVM